MDINEILSLIMSPDIQKELFPAKVVFIFFSIVFFIAIIYFMLVSSYLKWQFVVDLREFFSWQPVGVRRITQRWKKIQKRIEAGTEPELKLAVIEAEDLLNDVLDDKGVPGETFEEKIKQVVKIQLPNLEEVLEAHKTRNAVVYEPDYKLNLEQAKKILEIYERAIKSVESF